MSHEVPGTALARDEWIRRLVARLCRAGVDEAVAINEADAWIESNPTDVGDSPEAVAEDLMSYWTGD